MKIIIERFTDDNHIIIELPDRTNLKVSKLLFPKAKHNDIYDIIKDTEETVKRKNAIEEKFEKIKRKKDE